MKEQENLREVEKILDRTDEILEVMRILYVMCAGCNNLCVLNLGSAVVLSDEISSAAERRKCSGSGGCPGCPAERRAPA